MTKLIAVILTLIIGVLIGIIMAPLFHTDIQRAWLGSIILIGGVIIGAFIRLDHDRHKRSWN